MTDFTNVSTYAVVSRATFPSGHIFHSAFLLLCIVFSWLGSSLHGHLDSFKQLDQPYQHYRSRKPCSDRKYASISALYRGVRCPSSFITPWSHFLQDLSSPTTSTSTSIVWLLHGHNQFQPATLFSSLLYPRKRLFSNCGFGVSISS